MVLEGFLRSGTGVIVSFSSSSIIKTGCLLPTGVKTVFPLAKQDEHAHFPKISQIHIPVNLTFETYDIYDIYQC